MDSQQGSGSAANSADFVRKLYKMLEDPSYGNVVRWGDGGDSFVVLENEKFTKSILPKHFKHSNFASFVRQLNKYDFHKVRHNNEEGVQPPYGAGAWEFKHPDFKANNKDALDNIRRKAPVPRKANAPPEDMPTQQMDMVNTQVMAVQQQLQTLQERYNELSMHNSMLLQEVIGLQKTVVNHEHVMQNVMNFLHSVDAQRRRDSKMLPSTNPFTQSSDAVSAGDTTLDEPDAPASPLQHADKLLHEINADLILNPKSLEQMNEQQALRLNGSVTTPPPTENTPYRNGATNRPASRSSGVNVTAGAAGVSMTTSSHTPANLRYDNLDTMVYPVGQVNGIDPMYSEHINNIPYPLPTKPLEPTDPRFQQQIGVKKKANLDPGWIRQPNILLVEDDPTCRRIGGRFLYAFNCTIDSALDGLEAVNKMNAGSKYDLVLMDIIMPNLDGVSACHLIRQFDSTPIIAMTSNIRSDDISMYFQHGMNDVLPKPFTKEGLLAMLEKHLLHLKEDTVNIDHQGASPSNHQLHMNSLPGASMHGNSHSHSNHQSVHDEDSPSPSHRQQNLGTPATTNPSGEDYLSAVHRGASGGSQMYSTDGGLHFTSAPPTPLSATLPNSQRNNTGLSGGSTGGGSSVPHRRHISDISGGMEDGTDSGKRHQMYAAHGHGHVQHLQPGSRH